MYIADTLCPHNNNLLLLLLLLLLVVVVVVVVVVLVGLASVIRSPHPSPLMSSSTTRPLHSVLYYSVSKGSPYQGASILRSSLMYRING